MLPKIFQCLSFCQPKRKKTTEIRKQKTTSLTGQPCVRTGCIEHVTYMERVPNYICQNFDILAVTNAQKNDFGFHSNRKTQGHKHQLNNLYFKYQVYQMKLRHLKTFLQFRLLFRKPHCRDRDIRNRGKREKDRGHHDIIFGLMRGNKSRSGWLLDLSLSICLSLNFCLSLSVSSCLPVCLPVYLFVSLSVRLFVCLSACHSARLYTFFGRWPMLLHTGEISPPSSPPPPSPSTPFKAQTPSKLNPSLKVQILV